MTPPLPSIDRPMLVSIHTLVASRLLSDGVLSRS